MGIDPEAAAKAPATDDAWKRLARENASKASNTPRVPAIGGRSVRRPDPPSGEDGDAAPIVPEHLQWVWRAFNTLSETRLASEVGPAPIHLSEIVAYCSLVGLDLRSTRRELLFFIRAMDVVWLGYMREKLEEERQKDKDESNRARGAPPRRGIRTKTEVVKGIGSG